MSLDLFNRDLWLLFILFFVAHRKETTFSSLPIWPPALLCLGMNPRAQTKAFVLSGDLLGFRRHNRARNQRVTHADLGLTCFLLKQLRLERMWGKAITMLPTSRKGNGHISQGGPHQAKCSRHMPLSFSEKRYRGGVKGSEPCEISVLKKIRNLPRVLQPDLNSQVMDSKMWRRAPDTTFSKWDFENKNPMKFRRPFRDE